MDKKGFTLVEMLAVIVILALVMVIAVPGIGKIMAKFRLDYYKNLESEMELNAKSYLSSNRDERPRKGSYSLVCLSTLEKGKYFDKDVKDYKNHKCDNDVINEEQKSYVVVYRSKDDERQEKYIYEACLKCDSDRYFTRENRKKFCGLTNEELGFDKSPNEICKEKIREKNNS